MQRVVLFTMEDHVLQINLRYFDREGDSVEFNLSSKPTMGDVYLATDGLLVYTPCLNCVGKVFIAYRVTEREIDKPTSAFGRVEIYVRPLPDPPSLYFISDQLTSPRKVENKYSTLFILRSELASKSESRASFLLLATDPDANSTVDVIFNKKFHDKLLLSNGWKNQTAFELSHLRKILNITYKFTSNFTGSDPFLCAAFDGTLYSEMLTIKIIDQSFNLTLQPDIFLTTNASISLALTLKDQTSFPFNDVFFSIRETPKIGSVSLLDNGSLTYTSCRNCSGTVFIRYIVTAVNVVYVGRSWHGEGLISIRIIRKNAPRGKDVVLYYSRGEDTYFTEVSSNVTLTFEQGVPENISFEFLFALTKDKITVTILYPKLGSLSKCDTDFGKNTLNVFLPFSERFCLTYHSAMNSTGHDKFEVFGTTQENLISRSFVADVYYLINPCKNKQCRGPLSDPNCTSLQRAHTWEDYKCSCNPESPDDNCKEDLLPCNLNLCPENFTCFARDNLSFSCHEENVTELKKDFCETHSCPPGYACVSQANSFGCSMKPSIVAAYAISIVAVTAIVGMIVAFILFKRKGQGPSVKPGDSSQLRFANDWPALYPTSRRGNELKVKRKSNRKRLKQGQSLTSIEECQRFWNEAKQSNISSSEEEANFSDRESPEDHNTSTASPYNFKDPSYDHFKGSEFEKTATQSLGRKDVLEASIDSRLEKNESAILSEARDTKAENYQNSGEEIRDRLLEMEYKRGDGDWESQRKSTEAEIPSETSLVKSATPQNNDTEETADKSVSEELEGACTELLSLFLLAQVTEQKGSKESVASQNDRTVRKSRQIIRDSPSLHDTAVTADKEEDISLRQPQPQSQAFQEAATQTIKEDTSGATQIDSASSETSVTEEKTSPKQSQAQSQAFEEAATQSSRIKKAISDAPLNDLASSETTVKGAISDAALSDSASSETLSRKNEQTVHRESQKAKESTGPELLQDLPQTETSTAAVKRPSSKKSRKPSKQRTPHIAGKPAPHT